MKNLMIVVTLLFAFALPSFAAPKHVPYKIGKFIVKASPATYLKYAAKGVSYPVRHPKQSFQFIF